jgi:hypothetical protein
MKVKDKVVNISDCTSEIKGKLKRKPIKEGTQGEIKKITPAEGTHLPLYHVKFPGHEAVAFYRFEPVKLRA